MNEIRHLSVTGAKEEDPQWLVRNLDIMGGPKTYEGYPIGWAYALSTPFPWLKQIASHLGGVRNGLVISWPDRIKAHDELRTQYHHVIDVMPTLLEAAHVLAPTKVDGIPQHRIDGTSMAYSFDDADVPSTRTTQYYEVMGNRGVITMVGWPIRRRVTRHGISRKYGPAVTPRRTSGSFTISIRISVRRTISGLRSLSG